MVADAVAAAKLPVGVVIGHAPAKAAGHALLGDAVVEDSRVAQSLRQPVGLVVKGFGGELLPPELADEISPAQVRRHGTAGLAPGAAAPVGIIVVGIHVLQQLALVEAPGPGRGAGGVQPVDGLMGALVKRLVIGAAADPHAPQKDTGVVAVLADHLPAVLQSLGFPGVVAQVLPAGHFREHEDAQLVAGIEERRAGGTVAGADGVAAQLFFQQLSIQPLDAVRHGIALVGVALVAVEAPQLHPLAVEVQSPGHKLEGAEAKPGAPLIQDTVRQAVGARTDEPDGKGVEGGVFEAPGVDAVQGAHDGEGEFPLVEGPAARGTADLGL